MMFSSSTRKTEHVYAMKYLAICVLMLMALEFLVCSAQFGKVNLIILIRSLTQLSNYNKLIIVKH